MLWRSGRTGRLTAPQCLAWTPWMPQTACASSSSCLRCGWVELGKLLCCVCISTSFLVCLAHHSAQCLTHAPVASQVRKRKWVSYSSGEELFGLPQTQYPELERIEEQVALLDRLYRCVPSVFLPARPRLLCLLGFLVCFVACPSCWVAKVQQIRIEIGRLSKMMPFPTVQPLCHCDLHHSRLWRLLVGGRGGEGGCNGQSGQRAAASQQAAAQGRA